MKGYNGSSTKLSIRDLWQSPTNIVKNLDLEFKFDTDVAASDDNHLFNNYFTEGSDALSLNWGDVNYLNPPYSETSKWIEKTIEQHLLGKTIVMLVPADTSVKWFKRAIETCNEARFISGRLSFINAETQKPVNGNNKGSVLLIWRAYCKTPCVMSLVDRDEFMEG